MNAAKREPMSLKMNWLPSAAPCWMSEVVKPSGPVMSPEITPCTPLDAQGANISQLAPGWPASSGWPARSPANRPSARTASSL